MRFTSGIVGAVTIGSTDAVLGLFKRPSVVVNVGGQLCSGANDSHGQSFRSGCAVAQPMPVVH